MHEGKTGDNHRPAQRVKSYDNDWFLRYDLGAEAAAGLLASWNVTYVIAQSRWLPMQDSAVASAVAGIMDQDRYRDLDDRAFRDLLTARGIGYFACLNIGFDPVFTRRPSRLGVRALAGGSGRPGCPKTERGGMPEYCFSPDTIARFRAATRIDLPVDDPVAAAGLVASRYRAEWTRWKCRGTVEEVRAIRAALEPVCAGLQFSISTLPFLAADFGGAVTEVFGQDVAALGEVVDDFEVMAYHQIMGRPASWPGAVAADIRTRSGRSAICTVQARPLYLEGMHAGLGRAADLDHAEFSAGLDGIESSPVEGVCIFTFSDLLAIRDTPRGAAIIDRLRRFRR